MDNERRIFDRFDARFPVKFKDSRSEFGQDVFLRDLSASGAHIVAKDRMFFNDRVALEVEIPESAQPLLLNGRVVWSKPVNTAIWDIGIEFDDVNFMKVQRLFNLSLA
jgi:Tfp pilus assembly protein PilZ